MWKGKGKSGLDVENPNPSQRQGQIHYQDNNGDKYIYDSNKGKFFGNNKQKTEAPKAVNKLLKNEKFRKAIEKGLKYLGENKD